MIAYWFKRRLLDAAEGFSLGTQQRPLLVVYAPETVKRQWRQSRVSQRSVTSPKKRLA